MSLLASELAVARRLAREAGAILLEVYATEFGVEDKAGGAGPVTEADRRANAFLVERLRHHFPGDGVVSEEDHDTSDALRFSRCWYVDPMDGTREFVSRNGEFAVHVGLALEGEARLGVVYQPVGERLWAGVVGAGATLEAAGSPPRAVQVSAEAEPAGLRLVVSRSHRSALTDEVCRRLGVRAVRQLGSVGLKCGLLAEASADLYVHTSPRSYRWDSCAPEALLRAAGGVLTDLAGVPYRYEGRELQNRRGLLGCNAASFERVLPVVAEVARAAGLV